MPKRAERPTLRGVKHGRTGYAAGCGCGVCRKAESAYQAERRAIRGRVDKNVIPISKRRPAIKRNSESNDSEPKTIPKIGLMEQAVIDECAKLEAAAERPTLVVAARNLAKIVDDENLQGMHNASTKQLMAIMTELRPAKITSGSKRKSGGRLATVGALTKVRRAQ